MTNIPKATMQEDESTEVMDNPTDEAAIIKLTRDTLAALLEVLPVWTQKYGAEGARDKVRTIVQIVLTEGNLDERGEKSPLDNVPCYVCWRQYWNKNDTYTYLNSDLLKRCLFYPHCS